MVPLVDPPFGGQPVTFANPAVVKIPSPSSSVSASNGLVSLASTVPLAANLVAGELALNTLDEKLYFKNSSGTNYNLILAGSSSVSVFTGNGTWIKSNSIKYIKVVCAGGGGGGKGTKKNFFGKKSDKLNKP